MITMRSGEHRDLLRTARSEIRRRIESSPERLREYRSKRWSRLLFQVFRWFHVIGSFWFALLIFAIASFGGVLLTQGTHSIARGFHGFSISDFSAVDSLAILSVTGFVLTLCLILRKQNLPAEKHHLAFLPIADSRLVGSFWRQSLLLSVGLGGASLAALVLIGQSAGWSLLRTVTLCCIVLGLTGLSFTAAVELVRRFTPIGHVLRTAMSFVVAILSLGIFALIGHGTQADFTMPAQTISSSRLLPGFGWPLAVADLVTAGAVANLPATLLGIGTVAAGLFLNRRPFSLREIDVDNRQQETLQRSEYRQRYYRPDVESIPRDRHSQRVMVQKRIEELATQIPSTISNQSTSFSQQLACAHQRLFLRMVLGPLSYAQVVAVVLFVFVNIGFGVFAHFRPIYAVSQSVWFVWFGAACFMLSSGSHLGRVRMISQTYTVAFSRNYLPVDDTKIFDVSLRQMAISIWPRLLLTVSAGGWLLYLGVPLKTVVTIVGFASIVGLFTLPFFVSIAFPFRNTDLRLFWYVPLMCIVAISVWAAVQWLLMSFHSLNPLHVLAVVSAVASCIGFAYFAAWAVTRGHLDLGGDWTKIQNKNK